MKRLVKKILSSKNKRNVIKITSGTMAGQLISLIALPILTRIYGVEIFGTWALITALAMIITSYSDFGMSNLIMIESKEKLVKTYKVVSTITMLISFISSLIITLVYTFIFETIQLTPYIFFVILFLSSFLSQQIQICYTWLNRIEEYSVLMKNPLINYSVYGASGIIFGLMGFIQYGFFIAHILGSIFTLYNMKKKLPAGIMIFNYKELLSYISENKRFASYQLPTNISNNLKSEAPTLLISILWGAQILGYYSIALRILQMPVILIAKAIGRVFFQVISEMSRQNKKIGNYVLNNVNKAMRISIIPMTLLVAFGDIITTTFLGEQWKIAGDFVRILALQYFFMFIQSSMQGLAITLDKQKYALIANTTQIFSLAISLILGSLYFDSIYIALFMSVFSIILIQIIYFSCLFKIMKVSLKKYIKNLVISLSTILILAIFFRKTFEYIAIIL